MLESLACGTGHHFRRGAEKEALGKTGFIVSDAGEMVAAIRDIDSISADDCRLRAGQFDIESNTWAITYRSEDGWSATRSSSPPSKRFSSHADDHYSSGWSTPRQQVNWTHFIFYGADIRESALDWFTSQITEIARIPASNDDEDHIRGLFLANHEVEGTTEWQVRDGQLVMSPADTRHHYLDEWPHPFQGFQYPTPPLHPSKRAITDAGTTATYALLYSAEYARC